MMHIKKDICLNFKSVHCYKMRIDHPLFDRIELLYTINECNNLFYS